MGDETEQAITLAKAIASMTYKGLTEVARQLAEMNAEGERDIKTKHGIAETMADWAEVLLQEAEIDADNSVRKAA